MKAAVIKEFKKDFEIEDVALPRIGEHDALVKVKASCLCAADGKIRDGRMPNLSLPHIPGHEVAGEGMEIGRKVSDVKVGDRVVLYMYTVCGDCYACPRRSAMSMGRPFRMRCLPHFMQSGIRAR